MPRLFDQALLIRAGQTVEALSSRGLKLATAESCTGGLLAGLITEIAGASEVFDRGFVTYSNEAKTDQLGVPAEMIASQGAVSASVARAMAEGALAHSAADLAVAVTGIAGPGGGTREKPVGLVHLAAVRRGCPTRHQELRLGDAARTEIRLQTVRASLELINLTAALLPEG